MYALGAKHPVHSKPALTLDMFHERRERVATDQNGFERLIRLMNGYIVTQLVATAVKFRIPDHLRHGPVRDIELSVTCTIGANIPDSMHAEIGSRASAFTTKRSVTVLRMRTGYVFGTRLSSLLW